MEDEIRKILGEVVNGKGGFPKQIEKAVKEILMIKQENSTFVGQFNRVASLVNEIANSKGWWKEERNEGELIALAHSELSEALEALRHGNLASKKIPEFSSVEEEFADIIIRLMDHSMAKGYRVAEAMIAKIEFNKTRDHMHGGKKF